MAGRFSAVMENVPKLPLFSVVGLAGIGGLAYGGYHSIYNGISPLDSS